LHTNLCLLVELAVGLPHFVPYHPNAAIALANS